MSDGLKDALGNLPITGSSSGAETRSPYTIESSGNVRLDDKIIIERNSIFNYADKRLPDVHITIEQEEGVKHDANKVRMELLPVTPLVDIAKVLTFGAKKYSDENWRKGISYKRVYGALLRHLTSWYSGEENDAETGESHLAHAGCCLLFLLEYTHTKTEFDDRYKENNKENK